MRGAGHPPAAQGREWRALGDLCFMRMLLWGKVSEGAGPTHWDNTCNDLRNPSQPVHYSDQHSSVYVCVWRKLCFKRLCSWHTNSQPGWVSTCFWQRAGQVLLNLNDLFTQNPKGRQLQPRAKQFLNLTFSLVVTKQHIPYWGISVTWWGYFESMTGLKRQVESLEGCLKEKQKKQDENQRLWFAVACISLNSEKFAR